MNKQELDAYLNGFRDGYQKAGTALMAHDLTGIEPMYLRGKLSVLGWQNLSEEARTFLSPNGKVFMVPDDLRSDGATLSVSWLIDELIGTKVIKSIDELRTQPSEGLT